MEIKVGDKVRVRKDAPKIYTQTVIYPSVHNAYFEVMDIEDGCANIKDIEGFLKTEYVIPLKYLIKVKDEAKEPKSKVGDRVRVCDKEATRYGHVGTVVYACATGHVEVDFDNDYAKGYHYTERDLEPYTEATEEGTGETAIKSRSEAENCAKTDTSKAETTRKSAAEDYWDAYTADLAREIAIVYAKQRRDVKEAVKAAKVVVEELKKK